MSGISDLNDAVAAIATAVTTEVAKVDEVIAILQQGGGLSDAQAEALAQTLQGASANLTAETEKLQGLNPPPAA